MSRSSIAGATLARGALLNGLAFLTSNLRAIFTFLVARLLGGAVLGTFGVAWAVADLASKFGSLGLDYSVMAFVARREALGDRAGSRRILRTALIVATVASLGVAVVGGSLAMTSDRWLSVRPDLARATALMCLAVPGIVLYRVSNGLSRGMKVMHHDIYSRGLTESLGTVAALLLAIGLGAGALAPIVAAIAGTLASGLVAVGLARSVYADGAPDRVSTPAGGSRPADADLIRSSLPIAAYDLLNIGVMRVDVIMLGLYAGRAPGVTLETVGVYAACVEVAGGLRKLSQPFTPILTPVLAEQLASGQRPAAEASYGLVARWMLAILLPAIVTLAVSGSVILRLFGPGFDEGAPWLAIAGAACALNAFVGLGETILMIERPAWNLLNTSIALAAAVAINATLIPRYGALGAAIGMLVPYILQGVLRGFQLTRLLHWRWPWRALRRPWILTLATLPVAIAGRALISGPGGELAAGLLFIVAYLGAWWVVGLEPDDQAVLARLRGRAA